MESFSAGLPLVSNVVQSDYGSFLASPMQHYWDLNQRFSNFHGCSANFTHNSYQTKFTRLQVGKDH